MFFETDVLRGLLDARIARVDTVSVVTVRLFAALAVQTGAHDVIAMLEAEPGLMQCADKEGKARLWSAVIANIEAGRITTLRLVCHFLISAQLKPPTLKLLYIHLQGGCSR